MKKALSTILAIVMIITIVGAMPFEASAGLYEFLNWGDKKSVVDFRKVFELHDYSMEINEDGELVFDNPAGTPYTQYYKDEKEPTQEVNIVLRWRDGYGNDNYYSFRLDGVKTNGKEYNNKVQIKSLMDAKMLPSGTYDVQINDVDWHTYDWEHYSYIEHYNFTRVMYGQVVYHSPHKMLDIPSHLRWEGKTAVWEPVKYADRYSCILYDEMGNFIDSKVVTDNEPTQVDFSKNNPYEGWAFKVTALSGDDDYIHSLTAMGPFYHSYQVTYWPNGGTGSQVYTGAAAGNLVLSTDSKGIGAPSTNYVFAGWSTTADGKNVVNSIYVDRNTDLYATWRKVGGALTSNQLVSWSLDESTGRLYIIGTGAIPQYTDGYPNPSPLLAYADKVKSIEIGPGITQIGDWAFANFTKLETLDFSHANSLYSIGNSAFSGCTALRDIIYPSDLGVGITGLGANAFRNCSSLMGFCLADGGDGQYLSYGVFEGCTSLQSVTLPKTLLTLADTTFKDCESLQMIFYGGTDEDWAELTKYHNNDVLGGARLFTNTAWGIQVGDDAYYVVDTFGQTGRIVGSGDTWDNLYGSPANTMPVPEVIVEEGILTLGVDMFFDCDFIKKLTLPSTLVKIEEGAIQQCNGLESLIIPSSVKQIASYSVAYNRNLTTLYLSTELETINASAFTECSGLQTIYCDGTRDEFFDSVYVGLNNNPLQDANFLTLSGKCGANTNYSFEPTSGTLTISGTGQMDDFSGGSEASGGLQPRPWYDYKNDIKNVVIQDGVLTVGENAFWNCANIETVDFGNTLKGIGKYAFSGCSSLTAVELPESVTYIGTQAFADCESLKSVIIPGKVAEIPTASFNGCTAMESILIPRSVKKIGNYAFYNCPSLLSVYYSGTQDEFLLIDIAEGNGQLEKATIYLNAANIMGWQYINGQWYYYNDKGEKQTGWLNTGGKWYFLKSDGAMATGWVQSGGKWYYMNSSGAMQTGWVQTGGKWYYMNSSGAMQTGWQKISNKWYYFNSSGAMQTGWQKISNKWYYFNSSGAMQTGWQKISNKWYYFESSGAMRTGWLLDGGKWYYLESNGAMLANTSKVINGKKYYFNSSGACTNP